MQPTKFRRPSPSSSLRPLDLFRLLLHQLGSMLHSMKLIFPLTFAQSIAIVILSQRFCVLSVAPNVLSSTPWVLFRCAALGDALHGQSPVAPSFMSHDALAMVG